MTFVEQMKELSKNYFASTYPQWLREKGLTDNASSRNAYAALGTMVQQFSMIDKATAEKMFAGKEVAQPTYSRSIEDNIDALGISLAQAKGSSPEIARDVQICITKLEDIKYRFILMIKPVIVK